MTSLEPKTPQTADREIPDTEVIVVTAPSPVFVDSTGRRRRLLRRLAYAFGALCMLYGGLISVSLAGGPVSSSAILPLPDLAGHPDPPAGVRPSPTPEPAVSTPPKSRLITESLPQRGTPLGRAQNRLATPRHPATTATPARTPSTQPSKSPATSLPVTRTVESTNTATASPSPSDSSATPKPPTPDPVPQPVAPVPPVPPAPPSDNLGSGGTGGGTEVTPDALATSADGGGDPAALTPFTGNRAGADPADTGDAA